MIHNVIIDISISASETAVISSISAYLEKPFRHQRQALVLQVDLPRELAAMLD